MQQPTTPTRRNGYIIDKEIDKVIQKNSQLRKQTIHTPYGSFYGAIVNPIHPEFLIVGMEENTLYKHFNENSAATIEEILEEPQAVTISTKLMNGASQKLLEKELKGHKNPDYLPHVKAQYTVAHPKSETPMITLNQANTNYNAVSFNQKDL